MKKTVFGVILMSISILAYTIYNDGKHFDGSCKNYTGGFSGSVGYDGSISVAGPKGIYNGTNKNLVISKACGEFSESKGSDLLTIKSKCPIFRKRDKKNGILDALVSELSYDSMKAIFLITSNENGFIFKNKINLKKLKYYPQKKVTTDKYGNFIREASDGKYTKMLIDSYYKVSDKDGTEVYVRKSCIE